jgi:hypothetical protein
MLTEGKSKFTLKSTLQTEQEAMDMSERMLSNPEYQPLDYELACEALGIDPERPVLKGM